MKEEILAFRKEIDSILQAAQKMICSAETTLAFRSLQLAKGWLGEALEYKEGLTPYNVVVEVEDIPETEGEGRAFELSDDHLKNANDQKASIKEVLKKLWWVFLNNNNHPSQIKTAITQSCIKLEEASMQYGFEIDRLRNENKNNEESVK